MVLAIGWELSLSRQEASLASPSNLTTFILPSVSVPVLSMTKVLTSVSLWSASPSLTIIPLLRSLLIPTAIAVRVARPKPRG